MLGSSPLSTLEVTITFRQFAASLPRWILDSRTRFSSFLARSFKAQSSGLGPTSAVFPIPLPDFGLFLSSGPQLPKASWSLCRKRIIHTLVVALNYVHFGLKPVSIAELGRQPSSTHRAIYRRLSAAITACDTPGLFPLPPGRAGPEFIDRLFSLIDFAKEKGITMLDHYQADIREPQAVGKIQCKTTAANDVQFTALSPYRSLNAERLKLSGSGKWPIADYLHDELWLPYLEPKVLELPDRLKAVGPDFSRESKSENLELALLWNSKGLAHIFDRKPRFSCRVFNAHKSHLADRQIGDRRWWNQHEYHPSGPSSMLPSGIHICSIHCPKGWTLRGSISDRKDFYHQCMATRSRSFTNVLPFAFDPEPFFGTSAYDDLLVERSCKTSREAHGDRFGLPPRGPKKHGHPKEVYVGFAASLFQGDHLGVEYALSAHQSLLQEGGLLTEKDQILSGKPFPRGPLRSGLVIDDFFVVSRERESTPPLSSTSCIALATAEQIYKDHGVIGSDEKTIRGSRDFKAIGAEVQAGKRVQGAGLVTVGSPSEKRFALAALSLKVAGLPVISKELASKLSGSWISVLMYRRPLTCILHKLFGLGARDQKDAKQVVQLTRAVAEELVLASIFSLLSFTDISVAYCEKVYATDASLGKGAITSCRPGLGTCETLWLSGDRKGAYSKLDNDVRPLLRAVGEEPDDEAEGDPFPTGPAKAIDFSFDLVEVCGGAGGISSAAAKLGLTVCTPLDISSSKHFDLTNIDMLWWILGMLKTGRFKAICLEPPCTTFSAAQHPASRSYQNPLGFVRDDPKTLRGNILAFRCICIAWYAFKFNRPSLLEQPKLSKMAWLTMWIYLVELGFHESILASCQFGSIHKKEFKLLNWGLDAGFLQVKCQGGHHHVRIEGRYTQSSAVYVPGVAMHIATAFYNALKCPTASEPQLKVAGVESVVINDLLASNSWEVEKSWSWKYPSHINVYESHALLGLLQLLTKDGGDVRFNALLDSRVAKGAHAKGRSSSDTLRRTLLKASSFSIAGNLHGSYGFAPTRLNTADHPTRFRDLPVPSDRSILDFLNSDQIRTLQSCQFSRAAAGWIRLYILVAFLLVPGSACSPGWNFDHSLTSRLGFSALTASCHSLAWSLSFGLLLGFCRRPMLTDLMTKVIAVGSQNLKPSSAAFSL